MDDVVKTLQLNEEALLNPDVRRDRTQVERLLAEDFVEFGSSGRTWTRDQIFPLLANETYAPMRMENFTCALLDDNVALVTYIAVRANPGPENTSSLRSSIWTNKSGEWRLRFHQGTRTL